MGNVCQGQLPGSGHLTAQQLSCGALSRVTQIERWLLNVTNFATQAFDQQHRVTQSTFNELSIYLGSHPAFILSAANNHSSEEATGLCCSVSICVFLKQIIRKRKMLSLGEIGLLPAAVCRRYVRGSRSTSALGRPFTIPVGASAAWGETWRAQMVVFALQVVHLHEPQWLSASKEAENQRGFVSSSKCCEAAPEAGDFIES